MIVREYPPIKWRSLRSFLKDLRETFPEKVARSIFRFNQRMLVINARRRPA